MKQISTNVKIIDASQGTTLGVAGDNYRVIISGEQTGNTYAVFDMLVPPGGGPAPHQHLGMQEFFYVTEGELTFKTTAGHQKVTTGGFVQIPFEGGIHCFKNESASMARVLCTVMPAGLEQIFALLGQPVKPGEFLPPVEITSDIEDKLKRLNKQFSQTIYPPDYLD